MLLLQGTCSYSCLHWQCTHNSHSPVLPPPPVCLFPRADFSSDTMSELHMGCCSPAANVCSMHTLCNDVLFLGTFDRPGVSRPLARLALYQSINQSTHRDVCGCDAGAEEDESEGVTRCGWLQHVGACRGGCRPLCSCKKGAAVVKRPVLPCRWGLFKSDHCPLLDGLTAMWLSHYSYGSSAGPPSESNPRPLLFVAPQ